VVVGVERQHKASNGGTRIGEQRHGGACSATQRHHKVAICLALRYP
jgi:hypothetical protein